MLASGAGTNLQALLDDPAINVVAVGSDKPDAPALARAAGLPAQAFPRDEYPDRAARDAAMADWLVEQGVEVVVLAGYMQLVDAAFLARFPDRVVNVHPALLPAFPGIGSVEQAIEYGVKVMGVTVHFVDEGVDTGAIIAQESIPVPPGADAAAMRDALRPVEHRLLCAVVRAICQGGVRRDPAHPRRIIADL